MPTIPDDRTPIHRSPEENYEKYRDFHAISKAVTTMIRERQREHLVLCCEECVEFVDLAYEPAGGSKYYYQD